MFMKDIAVNIAGIFGVFGGRAGAHIISFQGTWP
jgi:hypothetical protein